jgi:outer membrane protein assembly factor BamB
MDDGQRRRFLRLGSLSAATLVAGCGRLFGEPPSPTVADARASSANPVAGAPLTVAATVSNPAGTEQERAVELLVDGTAVANRTVTVEGNAERTVEFTYRFDAPGEYAVAVGDATVGTVPVAPAVTVESARVERSRVATGAPVRVVATVANAAPVTRERTVTFTADGGAVATRAVELGGEERTEVAAETRFETRGERALAVDGVAAGTVAVVRPVTVRTVTLADERVPLGRTATVQVAVENVTERTHSRTLGVAVDGTERVTRTVEVEGGAERTVDVAAGFDAPGERTVSVAGVEAGTVTVADSWQQFGYGPHNTGRPADLAGPTGDVETVWRHESTEGSRSVPAVVGDTVYWGTGNPYAAADRGAILALSADDGAVRWSLDAGGRVNTTPAVVDDTVVATTATGRFVDENATGGVVGVAAATGDRRWSLDFEGFPTGPPLVAGGAVVVATFGGRVLALDPATGETRWERQVSDAVGGVAASGDTLYVTGRSGTLRALAAADGSQQWVADLAGGVTGAPSVADGTVYAASDRGEFALHAVAADTGEEAWRVAVDGRPSPTPAVGPNGLYTAVGIAIRGFERSDGSERWRGPDARAGSLQPGVPAVADGTVYAGVGRVNGGILFAFDAASGDVVWERPVDTASESVAVHDSTLYLPSGFDALTAIREA